MKQPIRLFGIGLLTAGIIMLGVYFITNGSTQTADSLSDKELVALVEDKGYHVLTNSEYVAVSVDEAKTTAAKNEEQPETKAKSTEEDSKNKEENDKPKSDQDSKKDEGQNEEKDKQKKDEKKEKDKKTYTLKIEEGKPSSDISEKLEKNGIIDEASKFNDYLEDNDYSKKVQLGEFKVSSDMSLYEIAEAITR
ncbi:endolytic transglycosylase MltG [Virgibacillus sp. Bac330]|uniref:endolytic transglycosylase MltG n=1 Tax=Virgibacillus sp. Bac330 TaxID=2419841 RepID=UPI000EF53425|nr:endolytic transglycosylase MltG [Virgibacillus sp. Bac330]